MPSFDIVSEIDLQEVDNALNSAKREITTRYDFKGSKSSIERKEKELTIIADDDMKLKAIHDLLKTYFTRRNVDTKALDFKTPEKASGNTIRQLVNLKNGIDQDNAKKLTKSIKEAKLKVQASIRGEAVRVEGKKRDDLQEAIALIKTLEVDLPLQFTNFRD
jgi:uncharacterized protein YajQ (UPF0234 family)